jgi:hypothetical protein
MSVIFVRKAVALPGKEFAAIEWGLGTAKLVSDIVGAEVAFGQQIGGPIGHLGFRVTYPDLATLEAAWPKVMGNKEYQKRVNDNVQHLYVAGSGHDEVWRVLS